MAADPENTAPTDADAAELREAGEPSAREAVERPVLHSDGVVCA